MCRPAVAAAMVFMAATLAGCRPAGAQRAAPLAPVATRTLPPVATATAEMVATTEPAPSPEPPSEPEPAARAPLPATPRPAAPGVQAASGSGASAVGTVIAASPVSCPEPAPESSPPRLTRSGAGPGLRPVLVQIDNAIPARPALNLTRAAAVYEYVAEGGVTRFTALYTTENPGVVGPVRSARLIAMEIARQFEALLVYHGASTGVQDRVWNGGIYFVSFNTPDAAAIQGRLADRPAPHNSITTLPQVRAYAAARGIPAGVDGWPDFPRGDVPPVPPAGVARRLAVGYAGPGGAPWPNYRAEFRYVEAENRYHRATGGRADVDGATGQPITAETVVVQVASVVVTGIVEDVYGNLSLDFQLQGQGRALFFRAGHVWEGCWRRSGAFEPAAFIGPDGHVFPFGEGPVWIAVASPETPISREP